MKGGESAPLPFFDTDEASRAPLGYSVLERVSVNQAGKSGWKPAIALTMEEDALALFFPLLQSGVTVQAALPCTIQSFLCTQLGLSGDFVRERILSIVLDGHPVDDPEAARLRDGSQLALSSAMPGLAGAALRRASPLASFRGSITHTDSDGTGRMQEGLISVKLFNLMMGDLGPSILRHGICIRGAALIGLWQPARSIFLKYCRTVRRGSIFLDPAGFLEAVESDENELCLSVFFEADEA